MSLVKRISAAESLQYRMSAAGIFTVFYLLFVNILIGWRTDHYLFFALVFFTILSHKYTFRFFTALSAFAFFWIIYDALRVYPNFLFRPVHVIQPYEIEVKLFGIRLAESLLSPCEWLAAHQHDLLTVFAGISYLAWVPIPMIFALYLWYKKDIGLYHFTYGFLLTNIVGFMIYYLYPAAPPWYFFQYGNVVDHTIPSSPALLAEFDRIFNISVFTDMYTKNSNVFAAIPSLHSAYPFISLLYAIKLRHNLFIWIFSVLSVGIWFAAVYSQHHYVIDVILGVFCALVGYFIMSILIRTELVNRQFERMYLVLFPA